MDLYEDERLALEKVAAAAELRLALEEGIENFAGCAVVRRTHRSDK